MPDPGTDPPAVAFWLLALGGRVLAAPDAPAAAALADPLAGVLAGFDGVPFPTPADAPGLAPETSPTVPPPAAWAVPA